MAIPAKKPQPFGARVAFDGFELDEDNGRLTYDGEPVHIQPRQFAVLCALARRPGHLMTKGDLHDAVWGHRYLTESALKSAISDVRAALQDDPRQPRYIETVTRRGYRFIGPHLSASTGSRHGNDDARRATQPTLEALTELCRGDAVLADLIRAVAVTLEREHAVLSGAPLSARHPARVAGFLLPALMPPSSSARRLEGPHRDE